MVDRIKEYWELRAEVARTTPVPDCAVGCDPPLLTDLDLREYYLGKWVVFCSGVEVVFGEDLTEVLEWARQLGISSPCVHFIGPPVGAWAR